jgi:hypothetical protein
MDIAQEALDSAKSAHHRIDGLEGEIKDIRSLTTAMGRMDEKVDNLKSDVDEIKADVKEITGRPSKLWDYLVAAFIGAVAAGIVGVIFSGILK